MTETRSSAPPFTISGVTYTCYWVDDGVNEIGKPAVRAVWVSSCGRLSAGRSGCRPEVQETDEDGEPVERMASYFWASVDRKYVGQGYGSLKGAMLEAVIARQRRAA